MLSILTLAERPELIATVAGWHWDEWGHGDPDGSLAAWTEGLRRRAGAEGTSVTWVALVGREPAGSVALTAADMATHPELSPWLSGLFVVPRFRGSGVGTALVRHCEDVARRRDVRTLHLYTSTAEGLYRALGWRAVAHERYGAEDVTILTKLLGDDVARHAAPPRPTGPGRVAPDPRAGG